MYYVYKDDQKIEVFAHQAYLIYWNRQVVGQKVAVLYAGPRWQCSS